MRAHRNENERPQRSTYWRKSSWGESNCWEAWLEPLKERQRNDIHNHHHHTQSNRWYLQVKTILEEERRRAPTLLMCIAWGTNTTDRRKFGSVCSTSQQFDNNKNLRRLLFSLLTKKFYALKRPFFHLFHSRLFHVAWNVFFNRNFHMDKSLSMLYGKTNSWLLGYMIWSFVYVLNNGIFRSHAFCPIFYMVFPLTIGICQSMATERKTQPKIISFK